MYFAEIKSHGRVCSICGERRFDGKCVKADVIRGWGVGRTRRGDLPKVLYPNYPLEREVPEVCFFHLTHFFHRQRDEYWVCRRCQNEAGRRKDTSFTAPFLKYSFEILESRTLV